MGRAAGNRDAWWGREKNRRAAQVPQKFHQQEEHIPFEPVIVAQTDDYLVVDKPPFLPTTSNGRIVANTVQERLRSQLGEPEIVAVHRLDLLASGLVLLSRNPATRAAYQQLFQRHEIVKQYECLTVVPDDWAVGETRRLELMLHPNPGRRGVTVVSPRGAADGPRGGAVASPWSGDQAEAKLAQTKVTFLGAVVADIGDVLGGSHAAGCACGACGNVMHVGHWRLNPRTGRTHQLRATMSWLGYRILGEDTYGRAVGETAGDGAVASGGVGQHRPSLPGSLATTPAGRRYGPQLRLLATALSFTDPVTGLERSYHTALDVTRRATAATAR